MSQEKRASPATLLAAVAICLTALCWTAGPACACPGGDTACGIYCCVGSEACCETTGYCNPCGTTGTGGEDHCPCLADTQTGVGLGGICCASVEGSCLEGSCSGTLTCQYMQSELAWVCGEPAGADDGAACTTNSGCILDRCVSDVCVGPGGTYCTANAQCASGSCSGGVCTCLLNSQCLSGICSDGACVAGAPPIGSNGSTCSSAGQCSSDACSCVGSGCSSPDYCCIDQDMPYIECSSNSDCCGETAYECDTTTTHTCCISEGSACTDSAECCTGLACVGGTCLFNKGFGTCTSGSQCTTGECTSGSCSCLAASTSCATDNQCCSGACTGSPKKCTATDVQDGTACADSCYENEVEEDCCYTNGASTGTVYCGILSQSTEQCASAADCCNDVWGKAISCTSGGCCNTHSTTAVENCYSPEDCCPGNACLTQDTACATTAGGLNDGKAFTCVIDTGYWGCSQNADCASCNCDTSTNVCKP